MQLICLANSWRPGGRCLAGIDRATGAWIRPVPQSSDAIPEPRCTVGSTALRLLDIFEVELAQLQETAKYQRENRFLTSWNWVVRERASRQSIEPFIDDSAPIFHNDQDRVVAAVLDKLPPREWKSLQLVRPRNLRFERDANQEHRWRARFKDRAGNEYLLKLTDPEATRRLEAGERIGPGCLLTVSLARPWDGHDHSMLRTCYKIVAAVIEA
jgi:hypothetical protein